MSFWFIGNVCMHNRKLKKLLRPITAKCLQKSPLPSLLEIIPICVTHLICTLTYLSMQATYQSQESKITHLTDSSERARITMVRASRTWAAAITLRNAITRSCGFTRAAACSPSVIRPDELFSKAPWQPGREMRNK